MLGTVCVCVFVYVTSKFFAYKHFQAFDKHLHAFWTVLSIYMFTNSNSFKSTSQSEWIAARTKGELDDK